MTDKLAKELKNFLPQADFKPGFHDIYENLLNVFAEDVIKNLPKDHSIEMIEDGVFIVKKELELTGYEKFVSDAQKIHGQDNNKIPFAEYLEDFINATGRNQFFK